MPKLTILKNPGAEAINNTNARKTFRVPIAKIVRRPPFSTLYPIADETKALIKKDMLEHGYDDTNPVKLWRHELDNGEEELLLIDGNTRLESAQEIALTEITASYLFFDNETEALAYALHQQRARRNLSQAQLLTIIETVDTPVEGFRGPPPADDPKTEPRPAGKSADHTAAVVGTSRATVERTRAVLKHPDAAEAVRSGKKTINTAYKDIKGHATPPHENPTRGADYYFLRFRGKAPDTAILSLARALASIGRVKKTELQQIEAKLRID